MPLIADRFVVEADGRAWDLATGERVTLVTSTAGGPSEQASWAERCAWLSRVSHARLAPLLDYGIVGASMRFEAWGATRPWGGTTASAARAADVVQGFLVANERAGLTEPTSAVGDAGGRAVVIPDDASARLGHPAGGFAGVERRLEVCGREHATDPRLAPVLELLESQQQAPAALGVWVPTASDAAVVVRQLARASRLGGRVPVDAGLLRETRLDGLTGRSLVILASGDVERGWRTLIQAASRASFTSGRRHVVCFVGARVVRRVHTVSVTRPTSDALAASVVPRAVAARHSRAIATAARRASGSDLKFDRILFGVEPASATSRRRATAEPGRRAAEDMSVQVVGLEPAAPAAPRTWPAPGEMLRLRKQVAQVSALFAAGRHGPGDRLARHVMHALARRAEWADACGVALQLARALRRRGLSARALDVIEVASGWEREGGTLEQTMALALARAEVLIDEGRLTPAESILEPALAAALSGHESLAAHVLAEYARCLHWQGRDTEALQHLRLAVAEATPAPGAATVRLWLVRSTVAAACGRLAEAVALAARARDRASELREPELLAESLERCAEVQLAAGDASAARASAMEGVPHARRAHAPILAVRLRWLRAEAARVLGNTAAASRFLARYGRMGDHALPVLVRARMALLRDLLDAADPAAVAAARAEATGLAGLRHYAPAAPASGTTATPDDLVALLQCCQVAQDDRSVLAAVCGRLRARLAAAGVAFVVEESGQSAVISADGQRPDASLATRAMAARQLVWHDAAGARPAAAVPVHFAGDTVGALVATWPPASRWQAADVAMLLSTGATAAGPALAAVRSARRADSRGRMAELLGVSAASGQIRDAIERAAPAPFPVLVEGESGVGKELVARLLHRLGPRRDRACTTMNCAALPDDLVESELFGHARGAFTGAVAERRGVFEEAHGGTLFLDEVGELSLRAQAKLLRAIQDGEIRRVGENVSRRVDVRLITATNRDLRREAEAGRFRLDLLYRLDVLRVTIPPLRARQEDVPVLAAHLWRDAAGRLGSQALLAPATIEALASYHWPGNVRELQNVLAALAVRAGRRGVVLPDSLPPIFTLAANTGPRRLDEARDGFDRAFITAALARTGGRRTRAARELGLSRQGLAKLMLRLDIPGAGPEAGARA